MFFERPEAGHRAVLVHVRLQDAPTPEDVEEFRELVESAAIEEAGLLMASRDRPHPRWFVGEGKLDELKKMLADTGADLVIANHELTPGQQRNLEQSVQARVLTRTELILHIFADRARTHEGQLQVELAQLNHASTRLVRGWTHLDRQKGGIGLRGAGEKQLELDQRMLRARVKHLSQKLERVHRQRSNSRRRRSRARVPTVTLVGYTNAGKSTLFNALTEANVVARDQMFATLDPTMRQIGLPGLKEVVFADTVGFIRALPVSLVDAFKATLEEVAEADLLLHVVDAASEDADVLHDHVVGLLREIGAEDVPVIEVYNKIDLLPSAQAHCSGATTNGEGVPTAFVSAVDGRGLSELKVLVAESLGVDPEPVEVVLPPRHGKIRAWLYELGAVQEECVDTEGQVRLMVRLDASRLQHLAGLEGVLLPGREAVHRIAPSP